MCGLTGIYSPYINASDVSTFNKMLLLNYFRGRDSTGVSYVNEDGEFGYYKDTLPSPKLIFEKDYKEFMDETIGNSKILFGHTRAATIGDKTLENTHPFVVKENLCGMHNGTIEYPINKYQTDSEYLYNDIYKRGLRKSLTYVNSLDNYKSNYFTNSYWKDINAYSLTYYDKREQKMNFIRNSQRSLYFTFIFSNTMLWSSDPHVLLFLEKNINPVIKVPEWLNINKKYFTMYKDKHGVPKYFAVNPGVLMTIDINKFLVQSINFERVFNNV